MTVLVIISLLALILASVNQDAAKSAPGRI